MINKRLLKFVSPYKKYIYYNVLFQWISLISQIIIIGIIANMINKLFDKTIDNNIVLISTLIVVICLIIRFVMDKLIIKMSFFASREIKVSLRSAIFNKLYSLDAQKRSEIRNGELTQLCVEGTNNLDVYFGMYLPQFYYSLLAPLTLFIVLSTISFKAAIVLLICVPIIPISIMLIQKLAKKLLSKYWNMYGNLADSFLDNIQALTTLKIYQNDQKRHDMMNKEAQKFRSATMKVLVMQLNSIAVLDLVAFGGAAIGIIISIIAFSNNEITIGESFIMIMLSAEFFIPLRLLGSLFHIAMNGNGASKKIFDFLDQPSANNKTRKINDKVKTIKINDLNFSYDLKCNVLNGINININNNGLYAFVGESGCGKSTLAKLLIGSYKNYTGKLQINEDSINEIDSNNLNLNITMIDSNNYLFKGDVFSNLEDGKKDATDKEMWGVLEKVNLKQYFMQQEGLDTKILENGSNLSKGQAQRLALARALLHDSSVYIFDEATSNIDVESEMEILKVIYELSLNKIVIFITHNLANIYDANTIYVIENGSIVQSGKHQELCKEKGLYKKMNDIQKMYMSNVKGDVYE
ncbi:MAG: ABC transporter ATP-binding protein/permease [Anaerorhabdus sp.]